MNYKLSITSTIKGNTLLEIAEELQHIAAQIADMELTEGYDPYWILTEDTQTEEVEVKKPVTVNIGSATVNIKSYISVWGIEQAEIDYPNEYAAYQREQANSIEGV